MPPRIRRKASVSAMIADEDETFVVGVSSSSTKVVTKPKPIESHIKSKSDAAAAQPSSQLGELTIRGVETMSIFEEYFALHDAYSKRYEVCCVLLQVGSFFELYTYKRDGKIEHSHIKEISEICNLNLTEKKVAYCGLYPTYMMGFRDYTLEKYLELLTQNNYTVVVYVQEETPTGPKGKMRHLFQGIYSVGTYINSADNTTTSTLSAQVSNNIMCIWIEIYKEQMVCGVSTIGILTGASSMFEYTAPFVMTPATFDELERSVDLYSPCEVLMISPFSASTETINKILQYSKIRTSKIHYFDTSESRDDFDLVNCKKQTYIKYILSHYFGEDLYNKCAEFQEYPTATQSYCFLLNFIKQHNQQLVEKITFPEITNTSFRVQLPNHTLMQLNIIDDGVAERGGMSSILSLLNKTCSVMGRRRFKTALLSPTFDSIKLNMCYQNIDTLRKYGDTFIAELREIIGEIRDIEKIARQIVVKKTPPVTMCHLYESILQIRTLHDRIENIHFLDTPANFLNVKFICNDILKFIDDNLILNNARECSAISCIDLCIIKPNVSVELDVLQKCLNEETLVFQKIKETLNKVLGASDYIKEHTTEKNNKYALQLTKTRAASLKQKISGLSQTVIVICNNIEFDLSEIKMSPTGGSGTTFEIECPLITKTSNCITDLREKMTRIISAEYTVFLDSMAEYHIRSLRILCDFVAEFDVLQTKVYIANKYNYCRPIISEDPTIDENASDDASGSFVNVENIRHPLIEHINTAEIYVTNDVSLGETHSGILLYGVNAAGKTSLIRAIGICVIMAQCGMFVPCSKMYFRPYTAIYTRILGNDNLFKGLSTFQVEMSELRVILMRADQRSLVLGDELCSGSEIQSSLAIFAAGLLDLFQKRANYIFATHFFEITDFAEISEIITTSAAKGLTIKHLSVHYDYEKDTLVFDRKLRDGAGSRTYGLEVCKSLFMPEHFMKKANQLRTKYFGKTDNMLAFKPSVYSSHKLRGICEECRQTISTETHHIREQHTANERGIIDGTFHKNHPANLRVLCNECHQKHHHVHHENNAN